MHHDTYVSASRAAENFDFHIYKKMKTTCRSQFKRDLLIQHYFQGNSHPKLMVP